jgi:hypothetical protein
MKDLTLKIESKEVKVEVRSLRAKWTREMVSDLEVIKRENRKNSIKNIFTD